MPQMDKEHKSPKEKKAPLPHTKLPSLQEKRQQAKLLKNRKDSQAVLPSQEEQKRPKTKHSKMPSVSMEPSGELIQQDSHKPREESR